MKGNNLQQALLGRQLRNKEGHDDYDCDPCTLRYYGLQEPATIVAVWVDKDGVLKVQGEDARGHSHSLYLSNFQLVPEEVTNG